ncbi:MAG: hypothetical protein IPN74_17345 [Haliscomenobacter sp.]|nr:hypothetical protein [Haliscomenobacter sp.]
MKPVLRILFVLALILGLEGCKHPAQPPKSLLPPGKPILLAYRMIKVSGMTIPTPTAWFGKNRKW